MDVFHLGPEQRLMLYNTLLGDSDVDLPIGSWEWDPATDHVLWSANVYRMFRLSPETVEPSPQSLLQRVHPDDLSRVMANIETAEATDTAPPMEYRMIRGDGAVRHVRARGRRRPFRRRRRRPRRRRRHRRPARLLGR